MTPFTFTQSFNEAIFWLTTIGQEIAFYYSSTIVKYAPLPIESMRVLC